MFFDFKWKNCRWLGAGVLLGTYGVKLLASRDMKKLYTQGTAAVLRMKDEVLKENGALLCKDKVVVSDNIITSRGMGTSVPFGLALVEYFLGKEKADALAAKIVYRREA